MSEQQQPTSQEGTPTSNVVKCKTITEFTELTDQLFKQDPTNSRYTFKYNHTKGRFELKTTNNVKLYKFKSDQVIDVTKLEKINQIVLKSCCTPTPTPTQASSSGGAAPSTATPSTDSSKKKKK